MQGLGRRYVKLGYPQSSETDESADASNSLFQGKNSFFFALPRNCLITVFFFSGRTAEKDISSA